MNRGVLTLAAIAAFWTLPAAADPVTIPADVFLTTQGDGQYLAKDLLLGAKVQNAEGKIVGDIEDLILNSDNQVQGVVMGVGGFAGFGEKRVGVSLSALQIKNEDGKVTVSLPQATKEVLDALEPFKRKQPAKSLIDRAIDKAKELSDKGSVTAKDAYEKAKPTIDKATEAAKEALEKAKEEPGPALEKAREATKQVLDKASEALDTKPAATPPAAPATPPAETPAAPAPAQP